MENCDWICLEERTKALSVYPICLLSSPSLIGLTPWLQALSLSYSLLLSLSCAFSFCFFNHLCGEIGWARLRQLKWTGANLFLICIFQLLTVYFCVDRIRVRQLPIPWLPNGALPVLRVSRLVHRMWCRSVPVRWPVTAVTAARLTSAPTCKVCPFHT